MHKCPKSFFGSKHCNGILHQVKNSKYKCNKIAGRCSFVSTWIYSCEMCGSGGFMSRFLLFIIQDDNLQCFCCYFFFCNYFIRTKISFIYLICLIIYFLIAHEEIKKNRYFFSKIIYHSKYFSWRSSMNIERGFPNNYCKSHLYVICVELN